MGKRRKGADADGGADGSAEQLQQPHTAEGEMPQKRFYRARAHCNPLSHNSSFVYPRRPSEAPWGTLFPGHSEQIVRFVDIGCGFGGLTASLAKQFPDKCVLAMEIRDKVRLRTWFPSDLADLKQQYAAPLLRQS